MSFKYKDFQKFVDNFEKLANNIEKEIEDFFYEMALRALARTKKRTPVNLGDLRKQWELSKISKDGSYLVITLSNPLEYASFVEYGHRLVKQFVPGEWINNKFVYNPDADTGVIMGAKTSWVEGRFMASISLKEISDIIPKEWDKRFKKLIGEL
jgi:hypothetical protein